MPEKGRLYLVPTPIGNLEDITQRALRVLSEVDLIACEDTRRSGRLLAHFGIGKKRISFFEHNEIKRVPQILKVLAEGQSVAVISDGGSPGLSDPAYRIVKAAIENDIIVEALPGANAAVPALTASGMPTDRFIFEGFLPVKSQKRKRRLAELAEFPHTLVIYESVHRIKKTLIDIAEIFGERHICIAREISKLHEEYLRGTAGELIDVFEEKTPRGEFTIVISGRKNEKE